METLYTERKGYGKEIRGGKFIAINAHIKKERSQILNLWLPLKELENKNTPKPKLSEREK